MNKASQQAKTDVLIVGAGPTGLNLAIRLAHAGIKFRIIDKALEPGTTSRALVVHARTLEFYRQLGLSHDLIEHGLKFGALNYWVRGRRRAQFRFGPIGENLTPFPNILVCAQDEHERLLIAHLQKFGVEVERGVEFVALEQDSRPVRARLRHRDGTMETCEAVYLAACDGARSPVRHALGVTYPGGTYSDVFYVADVELAGEGLSRDLHLSLEGRDFLAVFPLPAERNARFVGTLQGHPHEKREDLHWEDVNSAMIERLNLKVAHLNWFSTYRVHHRVAEHFRRSDVFLLGDAAHVHSPVGGQGMNTGIGDATNLAWKLVDVLRGRAAGSLLDTFEIERRPFALTLVSTTDRAFTLVTRDGALARWVKMRFVPMVLPLLLKLAWFRRFIYRTISQTRITYRDNPYNEGQAGHLAAGDRLPWVPLEKNPGGAVDNFAPLRSCDWQVHIYGAANEELARVCRERSLALHLLPWNADARQKGLHRDALYLIRPDGYIGFISRTASPSELTTYLDHRGLQFAAASREQTKPLVGVDVRS